MTPRLRDKARDMSGDLAMLKAPLWARVAAVNIAQTTPGRAEMSLIRQHWLGFLTLLLGAAVIAGAVIKVLGYGS